MGLMPSSSHLSQSSNAAVEISRLSELARLSDSQHVTADDLPSLKSQYKDTSSAGVTDYSDAIPASTEADPTSGESRAAPHRSRKGSIFGSLNPILRPPVPPRPPPPLRPPAPRPSPAAVDVDQHDETERDSIPQASFTAFGATVNPLSLQHHSSPAPALDAGMPRRLPQMPRGYHQGLGPSDSL